MTTEITIKLFARVGSFAENKDTARELRINDILPVIKNKENILILDFEGIDDATQSFVHALLSDVVRIEGIDVLDRLLFKNCSASVKKIIEIVTTYLQE